MIDAWRSGVSITAASALALTLGIAPNAGGQTGRQEGLQPGAQPRERAGQRADPLPSLPHFERVPLATTPDGPRWVPGEVLVAFDPNLAESEVQSLCSARGCSELSVSRFDRYRRLRVPDGASEMDVATDFGAEDGCLWAAPNLINRLHGDVPFVPPPNDPVYPFQTYLHLIDVETAWLREYGAQDVVVAVIDSGLAYEDRPIPAHEIDGVLPGKTDYLAAPDMATTSIVPGYDFFHDDAYPNDDRSHGTAVAATIAQSTHNEIGSAGVAPGVTVMPIKSNGPDGSGTLGTLIDSIAYAVSIDADVINMSLGFDPVFTLPFFDPSFVGMDMELEAAHAAGIVMVASTGNDGIGAVSRPASHPHVIAAGASNFDGTTRAFYSQHSQIEGPNGIPPTPGLPGLVELMAPVGDFNDRDQNGLADAVLVETFFQNCPDDFAVFFIAGTSFAAPQISAAAALLVSAGRRPIKDALGAEVVRAILRESASDMGDPGPDVIYGVGQLDLAAALATEELTLCLQVAGDPAASVSLTATLQEAREYLALGAIPFDCPAAPLSVCVGKTNSEGCVPTISTTGLPSGSGSGAFMIEAHDALGTGAGVLVYGYGRSIRDFLGGKLCVRSPLERCDPVRPSGGSEGLSCAGVLSKDFNEFIRSGEDPFLVIGRRVNAQWLQKDPADPAGYGTSLSNAVEFNITP